jgi:hypothetical protein
MRNGGTPQSRTIKHELRADILDNIPWSDGVDGAALADEVADRRRHRACDRGGP